MHETLSKIVTEKSVSYRIESRPEGTNTEWLLSEVDSDGDVVRRNMRPWEGSINAVCTDASFSGAETIGPEENTETSTYLLRLNLQVEPSAGVRYSHFGSTNEIKDIAVTIVPSSNLGSSVSVVSGDAAGSVATAGIAVLVSMPVDRLERLAARLRNADEGLRVVLTSLSGLYSDTDRVSDVKILSQFAGLPDFLQPNGEEGLPRFEVRGMRLAFAGHLLPHKESLGHQSPS